MSEMGRPKLRLRMPGGQFWLSGSAKQWKVNILGTDWLSSSAKSREVRVSHD